MIAVATADKIGTSATFAACQTEQIHTLVTDDLPTDAQTWLTVAGVEVVGLIGDA